MPLTAELPPAVRYLVPGAAGGVVAFLISRVLIEPLIGVAVDYEAARGHAEALAVGGEHTHAHEVFSRSVQENAGAAVGIIGFGIVMGVLFAVAHGVLRTALASRGSTPDPTGLALLLSAGMFVVVALVPALKYPANPPGVGLEETVADRTSASLTMTAISVLAAALAVAAGLAWSRRSARWRVVACAAAGYGAVVLAAMVLLPGFHEVPGPVTGADGLQLDGFPAEVLADFRLYSMVGQAGLWLAIGTCWAAVAGLWPSMRRHRAAGRDVLSIR